ncbi:MAG TPA: hypothetical protein VMU05_05330 [Dongiaceae bacterium]|nr:hypothetical protein [Dongiaceae bacterium]
MKPASIVVRGATAFVATFFIRAICGIFIHINMKPAPHFFEWSLLTVALTAATLTVLAARADWRGWKLGTAVVVIPLAIQAVNTIEGIVFLTDVQLPWGRIFLLTLLSSLLMIPVWTLLFGRRDPVAEHFHPIASKSRGARLWRFVVCDFSYILLYIIAGMIIFPYVKAFYATQHLPSPETIIALQLLIRGPVFVVLCLLITRMLGLPRITSALAVGAIFTLLSGVAPLLTPNTIFPDSVRWVHFGEVTISNFVFAALVAWLWGQEKQASGARHQASGADLGLRTSDLGHHA